jgi:hypothetical protein
LLCFCLSHVEDSGTKQRLSNETEKGIQGQLVFLFRFLSFFVSYTLLVTFYVAHSFMRITVHSAHHIGLAAGDAGPYHGIRRHQTIALELGYLT